MAGLLHLIPRYLPRFGMAPRWAALSRPLVLVLFAINVVITLIFGASVEAQSGAYATGVLVLILSAAFAATLALWRERRWGLAFYTGILCLVFAYTLADNCLERPDGLIIGTVFTVLLILGCAVSRSIRSVEFRIPYGYFADVESLAPGAGDARQESAPGSHPEFLGGRAPYEARRDRPTLQRARAVLVSSREAARQPQ
jgi:hypothetical protein